MNRVPIVCLAVLVASTTLGCGAVHELGKSATSGALDAGIEGVAQPANQQKLVESIDSERVEDATKRLADGIVDGALATFADPERRANLESLATSAMRPVGESMESAVARGLDAALARFFSAQTQRQLEVVVRGLIDATVIQVADTLLARFGPGEVRDANLASSMRIVAREAALGFQDAVDVSTKEKASGDTTKHEGNVLTAVNSAAEAGKSLVWITAGTVAALLIAVGVMLLATLRSRRVHRSELAERDAALLLLAQVIKSTEDRPWSGELREALKDTLRDADGADYVRKLIRKKKELRLGRPTPPAPSARPNVVSLDAPGARISR